MSNDHLRFPSGITVAQAKKDAKRLAKERGIRLHQAQDIIAQQNGGDALWHRAIEKLQARREATVLPLCIPLSPERHMAGALEHHITVGPEASTIVILGGAGTGKSVLAILLAQQAAANGTPSVHYLTFAEVFGGEPSGNTASSQGAPWHPLTQLREQYPAKVFLHVLERDGSPVEVVGTPPPGSMIVLEETLFFRRARTEMLNWMKWASERRYVFVVTGQTPEDIFPPMSDDDEKEGMKYIGAIFLGHLNRVFSFERAPKSVQALIEATRTLPYDRGLSRDFVVATTNPAWMGVARYTVLPATAE